MHAPFASQRPPVSATNRPALAPINTTGQISVHLVSDRPEYIHSASQSPSQPTLPTPPSSSGRQTAPALPQASPTSMTAMQPPMYASHMPSATRTVQTLPGGQMVQGQGAHIVTGTGPSRFLPASSRPVMQAQQTNAAAGPSNQSQAFPAATTATERAYNAFLHQQYAQQQQQQLQYRNPPQIHSYQQQQQQQQAASQTAQAQQPPRRHSYAQPHQPIQVQLGHGIPQSSSTPNIPSQRAATHPSITIPRSSTVIDLTSAPTPPGTDPPRRMSITSSSPMSSRPNSAIRSASSTYPQSPSVPIQPTQHYYAPPPAPAQAWQQPAQLPLDHYAQQTSRAVANSPSAAYSPQVAQSGYQQLPPHLRPGQSVQQVQQPLAPQAHPQPHQQPHPQPQPHHHPQAQPQPLPQPPHPPQSPAHAQHQQRQASAQSQAQPQQHPPQPTAPSMYARQHAQSVLLASATYMEHAYRASVLLVAKEFDTQNEKMTALTQENKRLGEENTRFAQLNKEAEEERVFLRQERARLLEELAKAQRPESAQREEDKQITKQLLAMCKVYEAAMQQAKVENEKLKNVNTVLTRQVFGRGVPGAEAADADVEIVKVGPINAPKGLVEALKETIVQQYEAKLAKAMSDEARERQKLMQRSTLLETLLHVQEKDSPAVQPAPAPSTISQTTTIHSQPPADSPVTRPASTSSALPASLTRKRPQLTEIRSSSEQPPTFRTPETSTGADSFPTPPRTATPLELSNECAVKPEPEDEPKWPWAKGELIDLTTLDSPPPPPPPPPPPLDLDLGALEMQLNRELTEIAEGVDGTEGVEGERKRSLSAEPGDEEGVRKRRRTEEKDVDIVMGEAEHEKAEPQQKNIPQDSVEPSGAATSAEDASRQDAAETEPTTSDPQPAIATLDLPTDNPVFCDPLVSPSSDPTKSSAPTDPEPQPVPEPTVAPQPSASTSLNLVHPSGSPTVPSTALQPEPQPAQPDSQSSQPDADGIHPAADVVLVAPANVVPSVKAEPADAPLPATETVREEPQRRLSIRHLDLVYHTSKNDMTCRMCYKRKKEMDPTWKVKKFPVSAPWAELTKHCEEVHPMGYQTLLNLSPTTLAETRKHLLTLDNGAKQRGR